MANNDGAKAINKILREIDSEFEPVEEVKAKPSIDYLANYFTKVKNSEELFRFGKDLSDNLKLGVKNIAFTSPGLKISQQKAILGVCCFFDRVEHLRIAIVSDQLKSGVFQDLVNGSKEMKYNMDFSGYDMKYKSYFHHFDFFDYSVLQNFYEQHFYNETFDKELEKVFVHYDLILWDVPVVTEMKLNPHFHFRLSSFYQSLTVIVSSHSSIKQIEGLRDHFSNYKLNLSRVLFDTSFEDNKIKRKKFLGIF